MGSINEGNSIEQLVMTGFNDLDDLLRGGLHRPGVAVLASRTSAGKSALALNIAMNVARTGMTVGFFSLETSREQLSLRMISNESAVNINRLRSGLLTESEVQRVYDAIDTNSTLPMFVDTSSSNVLDIQAYAQRLHAESGLDLLVVDYLQLLHGSSIHLENRVEEMGAITRCLKEVARELHIPVLAISQLSRAVESRPSRRPLLSDLRGSGTIEEDADLVMFLHRDDCSYDEEEWEPLFPNEPYPQNVAEVIVLKNRHGFVGAIKLIFDVPLMRFRAMSYC